MEKWSVFFRLILCFTTSPHLLQLFRRMLQKCCVEYETLIRLSIIYGWASPLKWTRSWELVKSSPKFRARKKIRERKNERKKELRHGVKASKDISLLFYMPYNNKTTSPFLPLLIDSHTKMLEAKNLPQGQCLLALLLSLSSFFPCDPRWQGSAGVDGASEHHSVTAERVAGATWRRDLDLLVTARQPHRGLQSHSRGYNSIITQPWWRQRDRAEGINRDGWRQRRVDRGMSRKNQITMLLKGSGGWHSSDLI